MKLGGGGGDKKLRDFRNIETNFHLASRNIGAYVTPMKKKNTSTPQRGLYWKQRVPPVWSIKDYWQRQTIFQSFLSDSPKHWPRKNCADSQEMKAARRDKLFPSQMLIDWLRFLEVENRVNIVSFLYVDWLEWRIWFVHLFSPLGFSKRLEDVSKHRRIAEERSWQIGKTKAEQT